MITPRLLEKLKVSQRHGTYEEWALGLEVLARWGITGQLRVGHALTQFLFESNRFRDLEEDLYYTTASRLVSVFGRIKTVAKARLYLRNPQALANYVYADRGGNGPPHTNDGWRYRGSGIGQLTLRDNFAAATRGAKAMGFDADYVTHPELIRTNPEHAILAACYHWQANGFSALADQGDTAKHVDRVSGKWNRGHPDKRAEGAEERVELFREVMRLLSEEADRFEPEFPGTDWEGPNRDTMTREEYDEAHHPPYVYDPPEAS